MPPPRQKDWFDVIADFCFGAAFFDFWIALGFLRASSHQINLHWQWSTFCIVVLATTLITGSLAALFRNDFWGGYDSYSIIPPMEESVSRRSKRILWTLFALGCISPALLFVW